jgi:hypothetical protein
MDTSPVTRVRAEAQKRGLNGPNLDYELSHKIAPAGVIGTRGVVLAGPFEAGRGGQKKAPYGGLSSKTNKDVNSIDIKVDAPPGAFSGDWRPAVGRASMVAIR